MNILFLADNFPPERNAQASRVYERACYWVNWGHEVTVLTGFPNFPEGKLYPGYRNRWRQVEHIDGIRVVRLKTFIAPNAGAGLRILDFLSFMIVAFFAGLFERRPDVLVATSPQFFAAIAGWALAAVRRCPFVMELSDLWPDSIVAVGAMQRNIAIRWLEKVELFLYRKAARIVALTSAFKDNLVRRGVDSRKIDVVINGVDLRRYAPRPRDDAFAQRWGLQRSEFVIGYIGTHGMAHALENVLDAAGLLEASGIRFLFVGAGAERERLIALAAERQLQNVTFVPPQPKEMMPAVWSVCDIALVHLKNTPVFESVIPFQDFRSHGDGQARSAGLSRRRSQPDRALGKQRPPRPRAEPARAGRRLPLPAGEPRLRAAARQPQYRRRPALQPRAPGAGHARDPQSRRRHSAAPPRRHRLISTRIRCNS